MVFGISKGQKTILNCHPGTTATGATGTMAMGAAGPTASGTAPHRGHRFRPLMDLAKESG